MNDREEWMRECVRRQIEGMVFRSEEERQYYIQEATRRCEGYLESYEQTQVQRGRGGLFSKPKAPYQLTKEELEGEILKLESETRGRIGLREIGKLKYLDNLYKERNRRHHLRRVRGSPYYER